MTNTRSTRKIFNISEENAMKLKRFIAPRQQSQFVNLAMEHEFSKIEKSQKFKRLSAKIQKIKRIKGTEPVVDTIRKLRDERDSKLNQFSLS